MKPKIITKNIFVDSRGFFVENFKEQNFSEKFIQDNLSFSSNKGTVRGMHFQTGKSSQTKLVTVLKGKIIDVVMNMETFDVFSFELCSQKLDSLLVPNNYAHGFMTLEDNTLVSYKVDNHYSKDSEGSINWRDKIFEGFWPKFDEYFLSEKDESAPFLENAK